LSRFIRFALASIKCASHRSAQHVLLSIRTQYTGKDKHVVMGGGAIGGGGADEKDLVSE